jgi:hypothetical protein
MTALNVRNSAVETPVKMAAELEVRGRRAGVNSRVAMRAEALR